MVSLFIEPDKLQIQAAKDVGAEFIELHTGSFANAKGLKAIEKQLVLLAKGHDFARAIGLRVNAGHGLDYLNTKLLVKKIPDIEELNIGHSIISRAVLVGLDKAVREMKEIIDKYTNK